MKLQDLLSVLQGSPYISIYLYSHAYDTKNAIFRGLLAQLPYVRVKSFLNHDVKTVVHLDSLVIILKD